MAFICKSSYSYMHMHHTGLQEETLTEARAEQEEVDHPEEPEDAGQEEDLPECIDHHPSSLERGKPQSI
jgi:hypothetical protein